MLGAGAWARHAHLPGYLRDSRCKVVAIADPNRTLAQQAASDFGIPIVVRDHTEVVGRDDIDLVDVCTPSATHLELSLAALEGGKHVLCEKPVAFDYRETLRAAARARSRKLKTRLGFTFRYSPAMRYMKSLIDEGVPAHVLTAALLERFASRDRDLFQNKVLSAMRLAFGGHVEKK